MPRDGTATREKILDAAVELIMQKGFGATSIDQVIAGAGVTKGSFFYHFANKGELARGVIERYARQEDDLLAGLMERAESLSRDPLQQVLIFWRLLEEMAGQFSMEEMGCLFASFCYENQLFADDIRQVVARGILNWREAIGAKLGAALDRVEVGQEVTAESLADFAMTTIEGAFIMSRSLDDPTLFAGQIAHYRIYLESLFGVE